MQAEISSYIGKETDDAVKTTKSTSLGQSSRKRAPPPEAELVPRKVLSDQTEVAARELALTLDLERSAPDGAEAETTEEKATQEAPSAVRETINLQLRPERVIKESEKTALLVFEDDTFDLSGDSGTIGCVKWAHQQDTGDIRLCLDLKGVVYETRSFPLRGSGLIVDLANQRVEAVLNQVTYVFPSSTDGESVQLIRGTLEPFLCGGSIAADNLDSA
ncbi:hypothetical protein CCYA_CCYA05G1597 [Cyanidiococcus yangmingshanensis]|nr:hypothetical protein CCYA_CCYA05G1597 [Cyanidiococcus yangmingshanensis]